MANAEQRALAAKLRAAIDKYRDEVLQVLIDSCGNVFSDEDSCQTFVEAAQSGCETLETIAGDVENGVDGAEERFQRLFVVILTTTRDEIAEQEALTLDAATRKVLGNTLADLRGKIQTVANAGNIFAFVAGTIGISTALAALYKKLKQLGVFSK
jgi:hypothetical protein